MAMDTSDRQTEQEYEDRNRDFGSDNTAALVADVLAQARALLGEDPEVAPSEGEDPIPSEGVFQKDPEPLPHGPGEVGDGPRVDLAAELELEVTLIEQERAGDLDPVILAEIEPIEPPVEPPVEPLMATDEDGPFLGEPAQTSEPTESDMDGINQGPTDDSGAVSFAESVDEIDASAREAVAMSEEFALDSTESEPNRNDAEALDVGIPTPQTTDLSDSSDVERTVEQVESIVEDVFEELSAPPTIQSPAPLRETAASVASDISPGLDPKMAEMMEIEEFSSVGADDAVETEAPSVPVLEEPELASVEEPETSDVDPPAIVEDQLEPVMNAQLEPVQQDEVKEDTTGGLSALLAAPRNWLPQKHRHLVDIAAISLACWVPMAWGFAFFSPPTRESPRIESIPAMSAPMEEAPATNAGADPGKAEDQNAGSE